MSIFATTSKFDDNVIAEARRYFNGCTFRVSICDKCGQSSMEPLPRLPNGEYHPANLTGYDKAGNMDTSLITAYGSFQEIKPVAVTAGSADSDSVFVTPKIDWPYYREVFKRAGIKLIETHLDKCRFCSPTPSKKDKVLQVGGVPITNQRQLQAAAMLENIALWLNIPVEDLIAGLRGFMSDKQINFWKRLRGE